MDRDLREPTAHGGDVTYCVPLWSRGAYFGVMCWEETEELVPETAGKREADRYGDSVYGVCRAYNGTGEGTR